LKPYHKKPFQKTRHCFQGTLFAFLPAVRHPAHAVLDVIVDYKIQFLVVKAVMFCKELIDLVSKIGML